MLKALLLSVWYDLSDVKLAEALDDRASFRRFCPFAASELTPERAAKSFFSRRHQAEIGMHHHIAGQYLHAYARGMAWREDARRIDNGTQLLNMSLLTLTHPPFFTWKGYWQRAKRRSSSL